MYFSSLSYHEARVGVGVMSGYNGCQTRDHYLKPKQVIVEFRHFIAIFVAPKYYKLGDFQADFAVTKSGTSTQNMILNSYRTDSPSLWAETTNFLIRQTPGSQSWEPHISHQNCENRNPKLSPLLYTLFTHDCVVSQTNTSMMKCTDDTKVIGLIIGGEET